MEDLLCAARTGQGGTGFAGAAGAENHHHPVSQLDAVAVQQGVETVVVGVVSDQFSRPVDHRIDRADRPRPFIQLVEQRNDRLFIGNRHIDRRKLPRGKKGGELFRFELDQVIGVICQLLMNPFGKTVPQLSADQAVTLRLHPTRSFTFVCL